MQSTQGLPPNPYWGPLIPLRKAHERWTDDTIDVIWTCFSTTVTTPSGLSFATLAGFCLESGNGSLKGRVACSHGVALHLKIIDNWNFYSKPGSATRLPNTACIHDEASVDFTLIHYL